MARKVFTIFLVDNDLGVLKALSKILQTGGYRIRAYSSSARFLDEHDPSVSGCAVLDLSMPGLNGLNVQKALTRQEIDRPIIFLTGHVTIRATVLAMRAGAIDVLLKPFKRLELLQAIKRAEERDKMNRDAVAARREILTLVQKLSAREKEVLTHLISGRPNKVIAANLGIAVKTTKVHRGRVMEKMGVRSVLELVRMAEKISLQPSPPLRLAANKVDSINGHFLRQGHSIENLPS